MKFKSIAKGILINFIWDVIKGMMLSSVPLMAALIERSSFRVFDNVTFIFISCAYFLMVIPYWFYTSLEVFSRHTVNRKYEEWVDFSTNKGPAVEKSALSSNLLRGEEIDKLLSQAQISALPWRAWLASGVISIGISVVLWKVLPPLALRVSFCIGHIF